MTIKNFQRAALALAVVAGLVAPTLAQAQATPWLVRVRAVNIDPANKDSIDVADVSVSKKTIPEVDISYFFTPNLSAELILTYPQKHDVSATIPSLSVDGKIGTLKHLPPTLSAYYHFTDLGAFKPYVGAGLNYTRFSSVDLPAGFTIDKNSFGLSVGAGFDYEIQKNVYLNLDVKKVQIRTDLSLNGAGLGKIKVDPLLVGVGVGYRF